MKPEDRDVVTRTTAPVNAACAVVTARSVANAGSEGRANNTAAMDERIRRIRDKAARDHAATMAYLARQGVGRR